MTDLPTLFENYVRPYGVSIFAGKKQDAYTDLRNEVVKNKGRLDHVDTEWEDRPLFKKLKTDNVYYGQVLYWSSSFPNLEYDVVYLDLNAIKDHEDYKATLYEYWQMVRVGGVFVGNIKGNSINTVIEAFGLDNLSIHLDEEDGEEVGYWYRTK